VVKIRKKKEPTYSDYGPGEKTQHGVYQEIETKVAGIKALRNLTIDPITTYHNRGSVSERQFVAAETFGGQYRRAHLAAVYAQVRYDNMPGGEPSDEAAVAIQYAKERVRAALNHVGYPLAGVVEHVIGDGLTAGSWRGVKKSRRSDQDGMVALRLALDGLVNYYQIPKLA
jgi:hypothetical protein